MRQRLLVPCLAAALLAGGPLLTAPASGQSARPDAGSVAFPDAAKRRLVGHVYGPDGKLWDDVAVTATRPGAARPSATSLTYGGAFELWLSAGEYVIAFEDLSERVPEQRRAGVVEVPAGTGRVVLGAQHLTRGPARNTERPRILGPVRVGETVRADAGAWKPATGLSFDYTWLVDGEAVGTGASLPLAPRHAGEDLQLRVRAGSTAWSPAVAASARSEVEKARTRLVATGPAGEVRRGRPVTISVQVADPTQHGTVRGQLSVLAGREKLAGQRVESADGRAKVLLTGLPVGVHQLAVVWAESRYAAASRTTVVVRVRR